MPYQKHRDEKETYTFDFVNRLAQGETLSAPEVRLARQTGQDLYADKTAEFGAPGPTVSTTKVNFTLNAAAAAADQAQGDDYVVYVKVNTSGGRILVGTNALSVSKAGAV